ncbi:MAG: biotin--[acetyl-CoA-carboxylase] ligase [Gammaproteobacteria bacterium]|nr:biotin--[acetyl-CoA-carboxylase] ligase [Gammaproteobacteria bacterium]
MIAGSLRYPSESVFSGPNSSAAGVNGPARAWTADAEPDRMLLAQLADGRLHSGVDLARKLGVTRAAVWKRIAALAGRGVRLDRIRGRGYRLGRPVELLDAGEILNRLRPDIRRALREVRAEFSLDSTNLALLREADCHGRLLLAEFQTHGRGRRGNQWLSPPASGICMSLGWRLDPIPAGAGALSILTGAAMMRALRLCGMESVGLKWPNDIVFEGRKLGGLLVESRAQHAGPMDVVIGVGINVSLPDDLRIPGDNVPVDLARCCTSPPSRNVLCARMAEALIDMLTALGSGRIGDYFDEWRRHDVGAGRDGALRLGRKVVRGRVLGISDSGMLRMLVGGVEREFSSGDLSLRLR